MSASGMCESCEECSSSVWCDICQATYCDTCDTAVHRPLNFRKHIRSPISETPTDNIRLMYCEIHKDKFLDLYCFDDNTLICDHCSRIGEHKGHKCDLLSTVLQTKKDKIQEGMNNILAEVDGITCLTEKVKTVLQQLEKGRDFYVPERPDRKKQNIDLLISRSPKENITIMFDCMVDLLNERRYTLLREVDELYLIKEQALQSQLEDLNKISSLAKSNLEMAGELLSVCDPSSASSLDYPSFTKSKNVAGFERFAEMSTQLEKCFSSVCRGYMRAGVPIEPVQNSSIGLLLEGVDDDGMITEIPSEFEAFVGNFGSVGRKPALERGRGSSSDTPSNGLSTVLLRLKNIIDKPMLLETVDALYTQTFYSCLASDVGKCDKRDITSVINLFPDDFKLIDWKEAQVRYKLTGGRCVVSI